MRTPFRAPCEWGPGISKPALDVHPTPWFVPQNGLVREKRLALSPSQVSAVQGALRENGQGLFDFLAKKDIVKQILKERRGPLLLPFLFFFFFVRLEGGGVFINRTLSVEGLRQQIRTRTWQIGFNQTDPGPLRGKRRWWFTHAQCNKGLAQPCKEATGANSYMVQFFVLFLGVLSFFGVSTRHGNAS